jgi:hypothetical protein
MALVEPTMAGGSTSLFVEVDAAKLKYRVVLHLEKGAEYESLDLLPVASGLAPPGARIHIKDDLGQLIGCMNGERGYSSYELYSGSPTPNSAFKKAPDSNALYSEWFAIADLVRGLEQCSKVPPEKWATIMISFSVRTHAETRVKVQGRSAWIDLKPTDRRQLSAQ